MKIQKAFSGSHYQIIAVMLMGLLLIAATDKKKEAVEFDFKKTSAYTHELDTRPDFPVSVIFARNYVYSVLAFGEKLDPKSKEKIVAFIRKIQRPDGGFSIDPANTATTSLYADFALEALAYMDAMNVIDAGKVKSYVSSLQRKDGSFSFDSKTKDSSLQTTYSAVHVLSFINGLDIVDKAKTAAYIRGFENKEGGGFNYVKGTGTPNATNTYMAVFTLKALGMLDGTTRTKTIKFLTSTPYAGNFKKYEVTQTLAEQAYAVMALKMLGAENAINKDKAVAFIKSFYIPANGGFGPIHGYGSAPDPTYFGIRDLAELGLLKSPAEGKLQ